MRAILSEYTDLQWGFFFFFYCFVGWIWECSFCSVRAKKFINRGFMRGPVIPIYGCGAITMLIAAAPFKDNLVLTFFSGMILASILEYCTGAAMEAIFKVKYWDYSNNKFNINGHICLYASCGWGFATILMTQFVHKPIANLVTMIPYKALQAGVTMAAFLFIVDYTLSFKAAWDIRDALIKLEAIKVEIERLQKRMDVVIAFAEEEKEELIEKRNEYINDKLLAIEAKLAAAKDKLDMSEEHRQELADIRIRAKVMQDRLEQLFDKKDFFKRTAIIGNPFMVSKKFKDGLSEIKHRVLDKK